MAEVTRRNVSVSMPPEENQQIDHGLPVRGGNPKNPLEGVDLNTPLPMPDEKDVGGMELEGTPEENGLGVNQPPKPLDMFALQEELDEEAGVDPDAEDEEQEEEENGRPNVSVFNVPAGEAKTFMETLPVDTYGKVSSSSSVQVNEVELVDVPVATRRIDDLAEYRNLVKRRRESRPVSITERVLINSGFIVTLKPASGIELSTIYKNYLQNSDTDYAKLYQFCYDHTIGTSIGNLSYNEYVNQVSPSDLDCILDGIYEISETPERTVQISCGLGDNGCGQSYDIKVKVDTLPDIKDLPQESVNRVKEIVACRNDIVRARKLHEESPVMKVKVVNFDDRYIYVRSANGPMAIERGDLIEKIMTKEGALIGVLVSYIEKITISVQEREDMAPVNIDLTTTDVIVEELKSLSDAELEQLKQVINNDAKEFPTVGYSLKGNFECPHCHNKINKIPCRISDLIFQKVQRMLM